MTGHVPIFLCLIITAWMLSACGAVEKISHRTKGRDEEKSLRFVAENNLAADSKAVDNPTQAPTLQAVSWQNPKTAGALVVYNVNAKDAREIAVYYAKRRGISSRQICGVRMPTGIYASKDQLLGARKYLVEKCVCRVIPAEKRPVDCNIENIEAIAEVSPVTHLVLIKGLPHRLYGTGWASDFEEPALDVYLSHLIYKNYSDIFGEGKTGSTHAMTNYKVAQGVAFGAKPPAISPLTHRMVAYGRVEAMDKERTFNLIERTLSAEANGISGNLLWSDKKTNDIGIFGQTLLNLTGTYTAPCTDYIKGVGSWPFESCRAGVATDGKIPAAARTSIPLAVNAGMYFGIDPYPNNQNGFNGEFTRMLNWRKTAAACTTLCSEMTSVEAVALCRQRSTDYFREINTDCVGVAPGFIGHQVRSYPVQFYGLMPQGWTVTHTGSTEKSVPMRIEDESAFKDQVFKDNYYLRFGGNARTTNPQCYNPDGTMTACKERTPMYFQQTHYPVPAIDLAARGTPVAVKFRVRYRNPDAPGAKLYISVQMRDEKGENLVKPDQKCCVSIRSMADLSVASGSAWKTMEVQGSVDASNLPAGSISLRRIDFTIHSSVNDGLYEWLEIDGVEAIDTASGTRLMSVDMGSFALPGVRNLSGGDYAANVIDRLGGIAWWGSGSHHLTGGFAFASSSNTAGGLFSGLSLGESVYLSGGAESGTIYGDPLYSPVAARIHLGDETVLFKPYKGDKPSEYLVFRFGSAHPHANTKFKIEAMHGRGDPANTSWQIDYCTGPESQYDCDAQNKWRRRQSGRTAVANFETRVTPANITSFTVVGKPLFLRLKVWKKSDPANAFFSYAQIFNEKPSSVGEAVGTIDIIGSKWHPEYRYTVENPFLASIDGKSFKLINTLHADSVRLHLNDGVDWNTIGVTMKGRTGEWTVVEKIWDPATKQLILRLDRPLNDPEVIIMQVSDGKTSLSLPVTILPGELFNLGTGLVIDAIDTDFYGIAGFPAKENAKPPLERMRYDIDGDGTVGQGDKNAILGIIASGKIRLPE